MRLNLLIAVKCCHCRNSNTLCFAISNSLSSCSGDDLTVELWAFPQLFFTQPAGADSSRVPEWMTHFCCLCTWSLGGFGWKSISSSHLSAHSFYPPNRGELMRKWLFQEVILDEASVFHFPFVPCLWNKEHKRKALSNLTGVSGIQLLGSSQLGFAWEEQRDWREEGRKEVGKLHHPTMDSLEDFSFSSNSQLISSYQKN